MDRAAAPLRAIGARILGETLPLSVEGRYPLVPARHRLDIPSAQVKSALLLAALNTPGVTEVIEPVPTRDHLERLLSLFGADIGVEGAHIALRGEAELKPQHVRVPGDPSAAAFLTVAALIVPGSAIRIAGVGVNPLRMGLYEALADMGADIAFSNHRARSNEPVADLAVRHGPLRAIDLPAEIAPRMIDEYPIFCVAAAFASGTTRMRGLAELRLKESDRIAAMAPLGAREEGDGLVVEGSGGAPIAGGFKIEPERDHRIAMAFAVAGLHAAKPIEVAGMHSADTSFPGFLSALRELGA
jgi:3-phosphoshikimate 1-carboxyvinyltransferase